MDKKYYVTNCTGGGELGSLNSEPMEYEKAVELFNAITKQARRGLRPFPDLIDEDGNIIM